jgi:mRNA interferase RelE/StbE
MNEGGYGKPLGNKGGTDLTGFLKIKLRGSGLRVVYKLVRTESEMLIVVVGARADDEVYETAEQRVKKYGY